MEQVSDKLLTNIPESGEYTVVLIMLHKERLQNILNNAINLLVPLGYSFNIIYKDDGDIKDVKSQYNYINWLKNAPIDYKLRFLLIGKPKKILLFDTDTWFNDDTIHNIVLNHDSVLINDRIFLFNTEHFGNGLQKMQTDSVSTFSERKRTPKNIDTQNILEKVGELGFISAEKKLTLPKQQIQGGRLNPVVDFISKISITKDYFFTLFDGWREWTDYSDEKIYIPVTDALLENFVNLGSAGETGRFIKKKTSAVPDFIYPKLPHQVLCYCRHKEDTEAVLIPDSDFLGTRGYVELKKEIDSKNIPFNRKLNIAYWRGNRTGIGYKKYSKYLLSQREMCVNLNSPNVDAKFSINTDKSEFLRHKFLIDIDGEVNAWSGLFWKLYSGSVVIKIESHWEQWYYPLLKPWENYVPVKGDLSDFSEVMECLLKDPELCLKISRNGRQLAESLTYENVLNNFVL